MKIIENVLTPETIYYCIMEMQNKSSKQVWTGSKIGWTDAVNLSVAGNVMVTAISSELAEMISEQLKQHLPEHEQSIYQFYVWQAHSGLALHNDSMDKFAATIYLNETWDINDGGLFVWKDKETGDLHAKCPTYNTMIINDNQEEHLVTAVSPYAKEDRVTIQLRGR